MSWEKNTSTYMCERERERERERETERERIEINARLFNTLHPVQPFKCTYAF